MQLTFMNTNILFQIKWFHATHNECINKFQKIDLFIVSLINYLIIIPLIYRIFRIIERNNWHASIKYYVVSVLILSSVEVATTSLLTCFSTIFSLLWIFFTFISSQDSYPFPPFLVVLCLPSSLHNSFFFTKI